MKKMLTILLSCGLALTVLSACGGHTHTAEEGWDRNAKEHWQVCECGEKMEVAAHELDEMDICTVCGSEVWDFGDSADVYNYDENGNMLRSTSYDAEGNVVTETIREHTYDADGNVQQVTIYTDGVLIEEEFYAAGEDGEFYLESIMMYHEDGSKTENEYDENGNVTYMASYNADDEIEHESWSEYAQTEDGEFYEAKVTESYEDGTKLVAEYNQYEDIVTRVMYDANGAVVYEERYEREYNEEGDPLWEKEYEDGVLIREIPYYISGSDEDMSWRCPGKTIDYYEDGTKLVTEYNENGDLGKEITYNADDSVESTVTYTYELVEDGEWTVEEHGKWNLIKAYEDGVLISETRHKVSSEGWWTYKAQVIEYYEDGTKTVSEYDENQELVSETTYDAAGNVVE